jgi:hypothetical protein
LSIKNPIVELTYFGEHALLTEQLAALWLVLPPPSLDINRRNRAR